MDTQQTEKHIFATGGAGFLRPHLCGQLLARSCELLCVNNYFAGRRSNSAHLMSHPLFEMMRHHITFPVNVEVDEICNLACPASPIHHQFDSVQTTKTSMHGAINHAGVGEARKGKDPPGFDQRGVRWSHRSSSARDLSRPRQPDWAARLLRRRKVLRPNLFFDYQRQHHLNIQAARIFNTYGPRMHPNDSRVLSKFITQALRVEPIIVCNDGSQRRSFCYVEEMVEGMGRLMDAEDDVTGPVNAGSPRENTILELAETVIELTTSKSEMVFEPLPDDDPVGRQPDTKLVRNVLAWEPKLPLREALLKTAEYFDELLRRKKELPSIAVARSLDGQPPMKRRIDNHTIEKNLAETRQQTELLML